MTVDEVDVANWRRAQQATGRLRAFNDAGVRSPRMCLSRNG